jgi:hypothetical protein
MAISLGVSAAFHHHNKSVIEANVTVVTPRRATKPPFPWRIDRL